MSIDYTKFTEITVKSQDELNDIPQSFDGVIYIKFGKPYNRAIVDKKYVGRVEARENSSVEARGNSSVVARGNSSVEAWGNSSVVAWENSSVVARENSSVVARGNSSVVAWENSSVVARGNSSVVARENSSVEAWENSSVEAWENSSVEADGNSRIVDFLGKGRIKISGNARIVYMPKTIEEYCSFYGIKHDKKKGKLFKAVRKTDDGKYTSDRNSGFEYIIGSKAKADRIDTNVNEDCGHGIHIAHLGWCLNYGRDWKDLAILEVEADLDKIILPNGCPGKVRCLEVDVIREVPLEECGVFGKILAKRLNKQEE